MNFTSQPLRLALGLTLIIVAFITLCAVKPALTTFSARPAPAPCTVLPVKPPAISEPYLEPGIARTIGPTGAFFSLRDVPRPAIAGIIGNGIVESAADPAASSMFGFGYLMWTGPARADVIEFAGQLKQPPDTLTVQLAYIWEELRAATWTACTSITGRQKRTTCPAAKSPPKWPAAICSRPAAPPGKSFHTLPGLVF